MRTVVKIGCDKGLLPCIALREAMLRRVVLSSLPVDEERMMRRVALSSPVIVRVNVVMPIPGLTVYKPQ